MTPVWKEVLCCGWQIDPRSKKRYEITPRRVQQAHRNFQKMKSRGVPVPACWEHQDIEAGDAPGDADGIAEWKRRYARYTFAHLGDSRINDRGNLDMLHEVIDPEDVKRLAKVKFVSPKIYNGYSDSRGGEYDGTTIVHSAATPSPVQHWQRPFNIELSEDDVFYLEYTPPDATETPAECPSYTETFTEFLDRLEMSAFAEPEEDAPVAEEEVVKKKSDGDGDEGGGNADLKAIVKALKEKFGANISDKVSNWGELLIAIESNAGGGMEETPEPAETPDEDLAASADEATTGAGAAPMVMSTLDRDPKKRARAEKEAKPERDEAAARVNKLFDTGRIDGPKKRALLRVVGSTEMSFSADGAAGGKRWSATMSSLDALEKTAEFSVWHPTGKKNADGSVEMSTTVVGRPAGVSGTTQPTAERAQVGADFLLGKIDYKQT